LPNLFILEEETFGIAVLMKVIYNIDHPRNF